MSDYDPVYPGQLNVGSITTIEGKGGKLKKRPVGFAPPKVRKPSQRKRPK